MSDVTTQASAEETTRTKIADRDWIGADGKETDEEKATGVRYTLRHAGFFGDNVGQAFDYALVGNKMLEAFGALTLMGNLVNTWKTLDPTERSANPLDMIRERFELLASGQWIDRTAAAVGARIDKDALASAIVQVATESGRQVDYQQVRQMLEEKPDFVRQTRQVPQIAAAYATIVGRAPKTLDDVLGSITGAPVASPPAPSAAPEAAPQA
jgi:hypothetical protein